jgi:hypothetical protein
LDEAKRDQQNHKAAEKTLGRAQPWRRLVEDVGEEDGVGGWKREEGREGGGMRDVFLLWERIERAARRCDTCCLMFHLLSEVAFSYLGNIHPKTSQIWT